MSLYSQAVVTLTRTVRFSPGEADAGAQNGYAGSPRVRGLERYFELRVTCRGEIDATSAYLVDIKRVDAAVAGVLVPAVTREVRAKGDATNCVGLLGEMLRLLDGELGGLLHTLRWQVTPTYALEMEARGMGHVLMRQKFDFAAAHRLHNPALSDEENRRLYGKCNNPRGHGHNYQFEPCVAIDSASAARNTFTLAVMETIAKAAILDRFDHRHLNEDTEEFKQPGGLNPSVENIAMVFFDLLSARVREAGAELRAVTVWETDRTCCTYPG